MRATGPGGAAGGGVRAQALVEFALTLPIFAALMFGTIEAARITASSVMVTSAAREAAHAGSFVSTTTDAPLRDAANLRTSFLLGTLPPAAFQIVPAGTDMGGPARTAGGTLKVTVNYGYTVFPAFSKLLGSTITMSATSTVLVE